MTPSSAVTKAVKSPREQKTIKACPFMMAQLTAWRIAKLQAESEGVQWGPEDLWSWGNTAEGPRRHSGWRRENRTQRRVSCLKRTPQSVEKPLWVLSRELISTCVWGNHPRPGEEPPEELEGTVCPGFTQGQGLLPAAGLENDTGPWAGYSERPWLSDGKLLTNPETKHCSEPVWQIVQITKISGVQQGKIHNVRQVIKDYAACIEAVKPDPYWE